MEQIDYQAVQEYLTSLVPPRPAELEKMEAIAQQEDFPIIGPACGQYCYQLARMLGARSVFELGSGFGYSTAWFARAVRENGGGVVHHTVWDEELSRRAAVHLSALGYTDLVQMHVGEAVETLGRQTETFDIIFNDIDKQAYPASLAVIQSKLRSGGLLIIDNMLWSGRIFDEDDRSPATQGIREFTSMITNDPQWIVSLAPVRDGMIIACKK